MSDELTVDAPSRAMTEEEADLAKRIYAAIQHAATATARGEQAAQFRVGMSDLGYCSERTRRMLDQQVPEDTDMFKAWLGTIIGDGLEDAMVQSYPNVVKQATVELTLHGDMHDYTLPGHPDLIWPEERLVIDGKSAFGLNVARRMGADQQKQFQRHAYGKAAWEAGYFGDAPLSEVRVGNVWLDRSGTETEVHVQIEPFSEEVLFNAAQWLDEVVLAYTEGREAMKEPAREVCAATCGFFRDCRAFDTDVTGLLTDPVVLEAVAMHEEGKVLAKRAKSLKDEAKGVLNGITGATGGYTVRWVNVEPTEIKGFTRRGYSRLDIRSIK